MRSCAKLIPLSLKYIFMLLIVQIIKIIKNFGILLEKLTGNLKKN